MTKEADKQPDDTVHEEDDARAQRLEAARAIIARFNALPDVGPRLTDADLYDEDGLPR